MKIFTYIVIAVVTASIIAGFFILGTPQSERMRRFDERRVGDLQTIQQQVINYWQVKSELPKDLTVLIDEMQGVRPPVDPETKATYEYKILNEKNLTFELCADFKTQSSSADEITAGDRSKPISTYGLYGPEPANWNWQHGVGITCFERAIDPDIYKPIPEPIPGKSID